LKEEEREEGIEDILGGKSMVFSYGKWEGKPSMDNP